MARPALLLCLFALAAFAPAAAPATQRIGRLELVYDPAKWRVEEAGALAVNIHARDPRDPARDRLVLRADLDYAGPCSEEAMAALAPPAPGFRGSRATRTLASGLVLHSAAGDSGCRNWAPRRLAACVKRGQEVVLFRAPSVGCRGWGGHDDEALSVLEGLRPR